MSCRLLTTTLRTAFHTSHGALTDVSLSVSAAIDFFLYQNNILTTTVACANGEVAPFMGHNAYAIFKNFDIQIFILI